MAAHVSDDLDWNLVKTFVTVAECGSLAAAAAALGLAHPTVARHVQTLEATLGVPLFDRRASGLKLNAAGRNLVSAASEMQNGARAFEIATHAVRTAGSGLVRITASEFLADVFPELLAPLRQTGDEAATTIQLLVGNDLLNLLEGEADIAIRHVRPEQQDLVCRRLAGLPLGLYASRSYVAEWGQPTLDTVSRHRFIDSVSRPRLLREAKQRGLELHKEQFVFRSDYFAGRLSGAIGGWGIAVIPLHVARKHPDLLPVLVDTPDMELDMWLVGRQDVRTTPYLKHAFATAGDTLNHFVAGLDALAGGLVDAASGATVRPAAR
ncbi:MAG: LysR family transcriptional regulator [Gammaproteobacteria bacterium]|nr:LysR family transcriptional regulator [Gammaproteobacteria bacterium]